MDSSGLARSLQIRAVCRCALIILPGSLGLMAECSRTCNEAGGKGGNPKLLWSIHAQFCVCASPEFRAGPVLVFLWKDPNWRMWGAAISSRTGVCPKAQRRSFTLSSVHLQNNLSSHLQQPDGAARLSAAHQDVFSPAEGLSGNTVRGNFWTMLPKPSSGVSAVFPCTVHSRWNDPLYSGVKSEKETERRISVKSSSSVIWKAVT